MYHYYTTHIKVLGSIRILYLHLLNLRFETTLSPPSFLCAQLRHK